MVAADHAAIVLAAGRSRRLGRPKQLLRVDGVSLLRRTVAAVLATQPVLVGVVLAADAPAVAAEIAGLPVVTWFNPMPDAGLSGSLRVAARALAAHAGPTLIVGVDQPCLGTDHLEALLQAGRVHGGDVVTGYGPAFGIPARVIAATLAQAVDLSGDGGLKRLWLAAPPQRVQADALGFDLDTPADLAVAVARGWIDA